MKLIIAIIKPYKVDDIQAALGEVGVQGMTVSEVKGFGRQKGHTEIYRGAEYQVTFVPKSELKIACADDLAESVVETIQRVAFTGEIGDGKIFVMELGEAIRIRTGETGNEAL